MEVRFNSFEQTVIQTYQTDIVRWKETKSTKYQYQDLYKSF